MAGAKAALEDRNKIQQDLGTVQGRWEEGGEEEGVGGSGGEWGMDFSGGNWEEVSQLTDGQSNVTVTTRNRTSSFFKHTVESLGFKNGFLGVAYLCGIDRTAGYLQKIIEVLHADVLLREKNKTEVKVSGLVTRLARLTTELEDEKQLNRSLRQNQVRSPPTPPPLL